MTASFVVRIRSLLRRWHYLGYPRTVVEQPVRRYCLGRVQDASRIDADERAAALVRSACSDDVRPPGAAGRRSRAGPPRPRVRLRLRRGRGGHTARAARSGGRPRRDRPAATEPPILYACFSRLPRTEPGRAPGIRAAVAALLDAGADPDAEYDHEGWRQTTLYGAAGIAQRRRADADADRRRRRSQRRRSGATPSARRSTTPSSSRTRPAPGCWCEPERGQSVVDYCLGRALNFADPAQTEMLCAEGARRVGREPAPGRAQAPRRRRPSAPCSTRARRSTSPTSTA